MKKFFYVTLSIAIILSILFLFSLEKEQSQNLLDNTEISSNVNTTDKPKIGEPQSPEYIDKNPIKLGIYRYDDNKRILLTESSNKWTYHKDIDVFNVIYTQKQEIEPIKTGECFAKYLEEYSEEALKYRIGFHVKFETEDNIFDKTILSPKDVEEFFDILEIYLYDGYHREKNEWYSHTTEEEFTKDTIFTAIKFTAGKNIAKITSNIELTAFSYIPEDLDENNNYKGNSKYSIIITKK